jgi:hypothetical protein
VALEFLELEVSPRVEEKINSLHGVTLEDVLDALDGLISSVWNEEPDRGRRLYVWGRAGRRVIFVCLRPLDEHAGEWRLVTAYPDVYP